MRLTQAIDYLNRERAPSEEWMRHHYSHYIPTEKNRGLRSFDRRYQFKGIEAKQSDLFMVTGRDK